jgi:N-acetylglucosamine kinase-like BadF-type ATPase
VIASVYQERFDLATVAPLVLSAAEEGDQAAVHILGLAAHQLAATLAAIVARMQGVGPVGVVFVGGLIDHDTLYAKILQDAIGTHVPGAEIVPALYPPVKGAVILAQQRRQRR